MHASNVCKGDHVLEIGPGLGALTKTLLEIGTTVLAVEKDSSFTQLLLELLFEYKDRFTLIEGDILKTPLTQPMKVVSNIPFQITVPILTLLATHRHLFSDITLLVQKEMAEKICALKGSKLNNPLAIFTNFFFHLQFLFEVSKTNFYPVPKIDCAVISLKPKKALLLDTAYHDLFFSFVKKCFTHKRKMLRSTLKTTTGLEKENARAEDLGVEDYVLLFTTLCLPSQSQGT